MEAKQQNVFQKLRLLFEDFLVTILISLTLPAKHEMCAPIEIRYCIFTMPRMVIFKKRIGLPLY